MSAQVPQQHLQPDFAARDAIAAALRAASEQARNSLAEVERLSRLLAQVEERIATWGPR